MSRTLSLLVAVITLLITSNAHAQSGVYPAEPDAVPMFRVTYDPDNDCTDSESTGFGKRVSQDPPEYKGGSYWYFPGYSTESKSYGKCPTSTQERLARDTRGPNAIDFLVANGWPREALKYGGVEPGPATVKFELIRSDGNDGQSALPSIWVGQYSSHPTPTQVFNHSDPEINGHILAPGDKYTNTTDWNEYVYYRTRPDGSIHWMISSRSGRAGNDATPFVKIGDFASPPANPSLNNWYYNTQERASYYWDGDSWEIMAQGGADGASGASGDNSFESFRFYLSYGGLEARVIDYFYAYFRSGGVGVTPIGRSSLLGGLAIDWRIRDKLAATASYKLGWGIGNFPVTEEWGAASTELGVLFIVKRWDKGKIWVPLTGRWDSFEMIMPGTEYYLANAGLSSGVGVVFGRSFFFEAKPIVGLSQLPYNESWGVWSENQLSFGIEVNAGFHLGNGFEKKK